MHALATHTHTHTHTRAHTHTHIHTHTHTHTQVTSAIIFGKDSSVMKEVLQKKNIKTTHKKKCVDTPGYV
jgi:hypothetical protein